MAQKYFKSVSILFVVTVFLFSNCGDNKDECSNPSIVGAWEMSSSTTEIFIGGSSLIDYLIENMGYSYDSAYYASSHPDMIWSIEFKSDNTYIQSYRGSHFSGIWKLEDNGNRISLDDEIYMKIISLSKDALLVTYREPGGLIDINEDGESETLEFVYTLAFAKEDKE